MMSLNIVNKGPFWNDSYPVVYICACCVQRVCTRMPRKSFPLFLM